MTATNFNLQRAQERKADEFYTRIEDVSAECEHYRKYFKDQTIYCNCDEPSQSAFVRYFMKHGKAIGIRKIIATCFRRGSRGLFFDSTTTDEPLTLKGDGDFRSAECINQLRQADIVVTNPPFSLFREYIVQLVKFDKKFLVLGNINAVTYRVLFPLIRDGKIRLGYESRGMSFRVPRSYVLYTQSGYEDENGDKYVKHCNTVWYTNLPVNKPGRPLTDRYEQQSIFGDNQRFIKYDNYNAIEVPKTSDIPLDYDGVMGVPITFLDKYNPSQFEILDFTKHASLRGKVKYDRILIKHKRLP